MQLEKLPSIWTESPLTIPYISKGAIIDRSKRFEVNSIYHKDDPTKPKKKVDQLLFPMKLLQDFRKNIKEAGSKSKDRVFQRKYSLDPEDEEKSVIGRRADSITKKLYRQPELLKGERDTFGNRCSMNERQFQGIVKLPSFDYSARNNQSSEKLYITAAQRINLSRPNNFNPGPGAYLKDTINTVQTAKGKLSTSMHSEASNGSGLRRKPRFMLDSIEAELRSRDH